MKTFVAKSKDIQRKWLVIDAAGASLGRVASEAARRLRGKHKPIFSPEVDTGDNVIIINAEKVALTGRKMDDKVRYWHTRYPGGLKSRKVGEELKGDRPERVLERAVKGMLPKNPLGRDMFRKLYVYAGAEHPHQGQQPEAVTVNKAKAN